MKTNRQRFSVKLWYFGERDSLLTAVLVNFELFVVG